MILSEIKAYFEQHRVASLNQLSTHFNKDPKTLKNILVHWIRKGRLRKLPLAERCSGCTEKCGAEPPETYEWVD